MPKHKRQGSKAGASRKAGHRVKISPPVAQTYRCDRCYSKVKIDTKCLVAHAKLVEAYGVPLNLGTIQKQRKAWDRMDHAQVLKLIDKSIEGTRIKVRRKKNGRSVD